MTGVMYANTQSGGQRQEISLFCADCLAAATLRLQEPPAAVFVNQTGHDYAQSLESIGLRVIESGWILPHHVYFVGSVEE